MKKLFSVLTILILSMLILAACGENKDNTNATADKKEIEKTDEVYFKDNEVKLNDLKIKIKDYKVIQVGEIGNEYGEKPVIAFWYDVTNLSDKEINPSLAWSVVFTAIQDNDPNRVNELEVGALPDNRFLDTQLENIKKGGTVENAIAYELDDIETPVKLIATQGIGGKKLGEQTFEIK
jgi:hypothetical protein